MHIFTPVNADGTVRKDVLKLVRRYRPDTPDNITVAQLEAITQNWVIANQKVDGHPAQRWQGQPCPDFVGLTEDEVTEATEEFAAVGFVDEVTNITDIDSASIDYVIVPGGTPEPQRRRMGLIGMLWGMGVRMKNVLFLDGRDLDPKMDTVAKLTSNVGGTLPIRSDWTPPTTLSGTETDLNYLVWNQAVLPEGMDELVPIYIEGDRLPGKKTASAKELVATWLTQYNPIAGTVLLVTVQPHLFQLAMWRRLLEPLGFTVECVAASARPGRHDLVYLGDGLGRAVHEYAKTVK